MLRKVLITTPASLDLPNNVTVLKLKNPHMHTSLGYNTALGHIPKFESKNLFTMLRVRMSGFDHEKQKGKGTTYLRIRWHAFSVSSMIFMH